MISGSYDAISSFSFSLSVPSCLCIDKIPEVAKTKVSKPKPKTAHLNTPPRLRHCVGRFAKHHPNVYAKKEGETIVLAIVLLLPAPCVGDTVFCCESETTLFGLSLSRPKQTLR